ncbi:glycosyl transferase family 1 [Salmonella enterica subsp. salamae]|nr:glycosyltransferase [Salmonella enterica]ECI4074072.1 glycosyl transferase family 1 [Salmonella enterica subsp. salamae]ECJ2556790.1 glycosyltransferase [Salmonella enterica subsp. salamae]SQJ40167.1 glycosyl transferase family 1 [Salmonella enterica]
MNNNVDKKRILVLTPRFPYPVIGGDRLRIYKLCEELSEKFELVLLSLCDDKLELNTKVDDDVFKEIHRVYLPKYLSYFNVIKAFFSYKPLQVAYYNSKDFKERYEELVKNSDAVLCHLIRVADYAKDTEIVKFIDMTDAISLNYRRVKNIASRKNVRTLIYSFEQRRLEKYERNIARFFNLTTFISPVDRDFLYPQPSKNIQIVNNGVDLEKLVYQERVIEMSRPVELVFIGNMLSMQNMDAALFFARKILPSLSVDFNIVFKVIGRITEKNKKLLNSCNNTVAIGMVDDINHATKTGHIGICSVRIGAGVQNKILEYMALGLPCITSPIGSEGIDAIVGKEIMVADSIADYKNALKRLINDKVFYHEIASNAHEFVYKNYSWKSKLSSFMNAIEDHIYENQ